jgi:hypothetical protein
MGKLLDRPGRQQVGIKIVFGGNCFERLVLSVERVEGMVKE